MTTHRKAKRTALLIGGAFLLLGIGELIIARLGEKTHTIIPAGHVSGHFMTPMQGYIIGVLLVVGALYAFTRALIAYKDHE